MLRYIIFAILVSAGCAYVLPPRGLAAPIPHAGRIVGGEETTIEDVPYQVVMLVFDGFWCGGSIVKSNAVVTAAHCVFTLPASVISFRAGSSNRSTGGQVVPSKRIFKHEGHIGLDYDISLVELSENIIFGASAAPIALASKGLEVPAGSIAQTSGWGKTEYRGIMRKVDIIRKVVIPIVDQNVCRQVYASINADVTPRMICAGLFEEGGKDACQGDSGGPLVVNNILVGVTSWGYECARPGYPGVWASVPDLRDWLDDKLAQIASSEN